MKVCNRMYCIHVLVETMAGKKVVVLMVSVVYLHCFKLHSANPIGYVYCCILFLNTLQIIFGNKITRTGGRSIGSC